MQIEIRTREDIYASFAPQIATCDLTALSAQMTQLKTGVTNLDLKDGHMSLDTESAEGKLLVTTIPYEKGWHAIVDGQETEILPYQESFLSLPLTAGSHHVELEFTLPGGMIGVIISAVGVIASAVLAFYIGKKR